MGVPRRTHSLVAPLPLVAVFVVLCLPSLHSAPTTRLGGSNKCDIVRPCRAGQASALGYDSGLYKYEFESEIETGVTLAEPQVRKAKVKAEVVLTAYTPCDFVLKVLSLSVSTSRGGQLESVPVSKENLVRFTLHDGIIGSVCANENEPTWTGNVKRAIISLLQNKALNGITDNEVIESDISGKCPTQYTINGDVYTKTKNLNACSRRDGGAATYFGVPYEVNSNYNSYPKIKSDQTCEQTLENRIIKSVRCTETHVTKSAFRASGPELQTTVTSTLTLRDTRLGAPKIAQPRNLAQSSIYFDHSSNKNDEQTQQDSAAALRDAVDRISNNIRPDGVTAEVPVLFLGLKNAFAGATPEAVEQVYNEIVSGSLPAGQKEKVKKLYVDAAADSTSDGAIVLLSKLIKQGDVSKTTKYKFYFHNAFAGHPGEAALTAVLPLLDGTGAELSKKGLLVVSGLAHQYCKITNPNCGQVEAYQAIVNRLGAIVTENIAVGTEESNEIVVTALQALGNLDVLTSGAVGAIVSALENPSNRFQVRALDAFRRDPCQTELKQKAQQIFANVENAANVRISAYLANVRCLEPADARVIQRVLDQEESIQVGGFIQSHLKNLIKNSSPSAAQLQSAARQLQLSLKYPQELRRFSSNLRTSMFNADANVGFNAEGNVIFSKDSFIPKQLSGNLTIDAFGNSYNLLELGAYLDNLDQLQESLLGPQGKFPFNGELDSRDIINKILKRRQRRSLGPVELHDEGIEAIRNQVSIPDRSSEPSAVDLYIRVFGTTIRTVSVNPKNAEHALGKLKEKLGSLISAARQTPTREIDQFGPILFLNDEFEVPTGSGLALTTLAEGTTIPSLDYARKYQAKTDSQPLDIQLKLITNSATSLRLKQSVVGGPFELGLQLEGSLRSGGGIELTVHSDGAVSEAKINLPHERVRAVELSTNVFWIQRSAGKGEVKAPFRNELAVQPGPENCDRSPINGLLGLGGLKLCVISNVDISASNPDPLLLRGKQYASISLEKTEAAMQGYSVVLSRQKSGNNREYTLELDTPGSSQNRKISVVAKSDRNDAADGITRKTEVTVTTPFKGGNVKLEVEETYLSTQKGIVARYVAGSGPVVLTAQVGIQRNGETTTYTPLLRLEHPTRTGNPSNPVAQETDDFIKGTIVRTPRRKISVDLRSNALVHVISRYQAEAYLRGTLEGVMTGDDYKIQLTDLAIGAQEAGREGQDFLNVNGAAERAGTHEVTDLTVKYGLNLEYTTTYKRDMAREPGKKLKLDVKVTSDQAWFLNLDLSANAEKDAEAGTYVSSHKLTYGPHDQPRLLLTSETNAAVTAKNNFDVQNKMKLYFPVRNQAEDTYDFSQSTHVKYNADEQLVDVKLMSGENGARAKLEINFERKAANNNDFTFKTLLKTERRGGELGITRTTLNDEESRKFTKSYRYDINLRSSTLRLNENSVTIVRLANQPEKRALVLSSQVTSSSDRSPLNGLALDLQIKSNSEKYAAVLGLKKVNDEFVTLDASVLKTPSATTPQVSVRAFVVNTIRLDLTRLTPSEGEANTKINAEILRTGRTVTLDVSRKHEGDVRKLDADLKWDAARDPTQSIQVHSVTKITKGSILIDSRNEITVIGKTLRANVNAKIPDDVRNGEHSLSLDVVGSDGKNYKIDYINSISITPQLRTSNSKVSFNVPDAPPSEVQLQLKSQNPNIREGIFDVTADLQVLQAGTVAQSVLAQLSSQRESGQRSVNAKLNLGGQRVPEQINLEVDVTAGSGRGGLKANWQFGSTSSGVEIYGQRTLADNTKSREVTFKLTNIPGVKYQVVEGRLAGKEGLGGELNILKEREIKGDGKILLSYRYGVKHENGQVRAVAQLTYKNKQLLNANLKGTATRDLVDVSGKLSGDSYNISLLTKIQPVAFPIGEVKFELESAAPAVAGIVLKAQNAGAGKYTGGVTLNYQEKTASVSGELVNTDGERGFAVALSGPNVGEVAGELKLKNVGGDAQEVSTSLTLNGKTVAATGTSRKTGSGYEGTLEVEVPRQGVGKATYGLAVVVDGNRRTLALTENDATGKVDHLSMDYTIQQTATGRAYEGTFSTDVLSHFYTNSPPQLTGTFKTEYNKLDDATDGETGRELKYQLQLSSSDAAKLAEIAQELPILNANEITVELKGTNREVRAYGKIVGTTTSSVEVQTKIPRRGASPRTYSAKAIVVHDGITEGFSSETTGTREPYSVDHLTKIYFGSETSDVISLNIKGKMTPGNDACEASVDLNLPARQISLSAKRTSAKSMEISAWLDKARQPDQKLNVAVQFEKLETQDGAEGYQYEVQITHPTLPKALVVKRKVVRFGRLVLHDSETELDIFQDAANKILVKVKANFVNEDRRELAVDLELESDGLGLDVKADGNVDLDAREADLTYRFKRPNGEVKSRKVHIVASRTVQSISVGDSSNPDILLSRTVRNLGDHRRKRDLGNGRDVRYELKLPGMTDTRVVDVHLHTTLPPHLNLKTFATGQGSSYEVSLGYPTERQFLVGFYKHKGPATTNLAQLSITLNNTQLLLVKANWDREGLQQFSQLAKQRLQGTEDRLEDSLDNYVDQLNQDVKETLQKITAALPDCAPFRSHVRSELQAIRQEIQQNPAFNRARSYARAIAEATKELSDALEEISNTVTNLPEYLKNLSKNYPAFVKRYEKIVRRLKTTAASIIANTIRAVRPIARQIAELIEQLTQKIEAYRAGMRARTENAVTRVRAASDNALAKLIELVLSRADELSGKIEESNLRPEVKEIASAVLNFVAARLRGENPDPEVLASQVRASLKKLLGTYLTVDVENGEIAFPVPLPKGINSLLDVRTAILNALPSSKTIIPYRNRLLKPIEVIRQALRDAVQTNVLTAATRALRVNTPPHAARAYIIGSQYLITFDGKLVHLEGKCQYLLLADFPKVDFKVAIQYHNVDGVIKKTIVAGDSDETAEITPDKVVNAHGTGGPHIDLIDEDDAIGFRMREHDLNVVCSKSHDVCTIDLLNGYLFGKVRGLLGNYNNEQYDDLRTPAGQRTTSEEEFARAYKLDAQCTEDAVPEHPAISSAARDACNNAFSSWRSPLKRCQKYSNPEEFESICNRLSTENGWTVQEAVCTSLSAYEQTCEGVSRYSKPFTSSVLPKEGCGVF